MFLLGEKGGINIGILQSKTFQKYFVPGIVFQSCVIAGGYGTGRELVEFFMSFGPLGGMLAICIVSMLTWSVACAVSFAFAHTFKKYDYKSFMMELVGPFWLAFEVCYIMFLITVLAVVSAAAGTILAELFNFTKWIGIVGMSISVFLLVLSGSAIIEKVLSIWSFVLYAVYFVFLVLVLTRYGGDILNNFTSFPIRGNWVMGGLQYSFYNLGIILAVLYTVRHCDTTKEAFGAGLIAGVIGILPAIMLFLAMCSFYPVILTKELPITFILSEMNLTWLQYIFQIVLYGTLIETGSGLIYAVTDRVDAAFEIQEKLAPKWTTPAVAVSLLIFSTIISSFGLINLISIGYGGFSWVFLVVYMIPLLTMGLYKILKNN